MADAARGRGPHGRLPDRGRRRPRRPRRLATSWRPARCSASSASPDRASRSPRWPSWACCRRRARITGSILFHGEELVGRSAKELRPSAGSKIAMIFQDPMTSLNPVYTIGWQLAEAVLRPPRRLARRQAKDRAVEMLDLVGIPQPARGPTHYPHEFSGGMRQRAMIAMAIINDPEIIIADEPTTALDVTVQAQILETLDEGQGRDQRRDHADHPRPRRGRRHGRPGAGDVRRHGRGVGHGRRRLQRAADAVHGRPARLDPARRTPWRRQAHARSRARRRR